MHRRSLHNREISYRTVEGSMDRLESMSTLLAVVDAGSLSAAARRLKTPLTTVSRRVSELETSLKTRLLTRSSRRVALTDAGRSYVAACKRILEELGEAERAAAGEYSAPTGDLLVAAPVVFGRLHVLPIAIEFLRAYPDIDIRLRLADSIVNILEEPVDLAVRIGPIRRVICASPSYLAARGTPKEPADLAAHDCITFEGMAATEAWTFPTGKSEAVVAIRSRLAVNTAEAALD